MGKFYLMLAQCCLGWGHLFLHLSTSLTERAYHAETRK